MTLECESLLVQGAKEKKLKFSRTIVAVSSASEAADEILGIGIAKSQRL
jgi:hypothetical protein